MHYYDELVVQKYSPAYKPRPVCRQVPDLPRSEQILAPPHLIKFINDAEKLSKSGRKIM
jgi:hypothetical protein